MTQRLQQKHIQLTVLKGQFSRWQGPEGTTDKKHFFKDPDTTKLPSMRFKSPRGPPQQVPLTNFSSEGNTLIMYTDFNLPSKEAKYRGHRDTPINEIVGTLSFRENGCPYGYISEVYSIIKRITAFVKFMKHTK